MEEEKDGKLPVLDMLIIRDGKSLSLTWYSKPTDTGLLMNYHALAPRPYKRSVAAGFVYRIHRSCSSWKNFSESLAKAKCILEKNQYPPDFYKPIIEQALKKIIGAEEDQTHDEDKQKTADETTATTADSAIQKKLVFIEYRGKVTEDYCRALRKADAPCQPVLTLRKLKTVLPSLKPAIDHCVRSHLVYQITCSRCNLRYIGKTDQYLKVRLQKHKCPSQPVGKHLRNCDALNEVKVKDVKILAASTRGEQYLLTLEALWQKEERPTINTKDEYKKRELVIMW